MQMKKILAISLFIIFLFNCPYLYSAIKDFSTFDGYNWMQYHEYVKIGLALGFLMGVHKAIEELDPFIRQSSYDEKRADELLPIYNITNTRLKEEIDKFYDDPENRNISIGNAATLVLKRLSPEKDIEMIEKEEKILKLPPEEQRVERIKDIIKEDIKTGRYPGYELKGEEVIEKETGKPLPLETEEEVTKARFEMLAPGVVVTKEVVRVNYLPGIIIGIVAFMMIVFLITVIFKKKSKEKKED